MEVQNRIKDCFDNEETELDLSYLNLRELPEKLPASLKKIYCYNNQLTKLPEKLLASLKIIYCYNNQLTKLPEKLPASLKRISCYNNQLTKLPLILNKNKCYIGCSNKDKLLQNTAFDIFRQLRKEYKNKRNFIK